MKSFAFRAVVCSALGAGHGLTGLAATSEPATSPAPTTARWEHLSPHALGVTLFMDNDGTFVKPNGRTDRHYTAGQAVAVQWQNPSTAILASSLPTLNQEFNPETHGTSYAGGVLASMRMYTPEDISRQEPIYDDRPYAGWTYGGFMLQRANRAADVPVFEHLELDIGTIGPSGQNGKLQKYIHKSAGYTYPVGWRNEIRDEFGADFTFQRRWRIDLTTSRDPLGPGIQLIPEAGLTVGSFHDHASAGFTLRAGFNLPDDFGPGRISAPADFTRAHARATGANGSGGAYVFLRPAGRLVAHDSTIEGSFFRNNPVEQQIEPAVAEIQVGLAIQFLRHWEFGYSQTYSSPEFVDQEHWDSYGSLTLRYFAAW